MVRRVPLPSGLTTDGRRRVDGRSHLRRREGGSDGRQDASSSMLTPRRRVAVPGVVLAGVTSLGMLVIDSTVRLGTKVERGRTVLGHSVRGRTVQLMSVDDRADRRQHHRVVVVDDGLSGLVLGCAEKRTSSSGNVGVKLAVGKSERLTHRVDGRGDRETVSDERGQALVDGVEPFVPLHHADREVEFERAQGVQLETVDLGKGEERDIGPAMCTRASQQADG